MLLGASGLLWLAGLARGRVTWRRCPLYLPLAAYVAASLAAALFSPRPAFSIREIGDLLTLIAVPMTVTLLDREWWDRGFALLAAVASLSAVVALWQFVRVPFDLSHRPSGLANHYMTFAGWTLLVTLLLAGDIAYRDGPRRRLLTVPAFVLCLTGLAVSETRGVWLGLVAGLVLLAAVRKPALLLVYPLLAVMLLVLLPRPLVERAVSIVDPRHPTNSERLRMLGAGARMVRARPLVGVGLGMVKPSYEEFARGPGRSRVPHLHNNLVQVAAERGLLAAAAYVALLVVFFARALPALARAGPDRAPALAGCMLAVAGLTVAGMFEYNWGDAEIWLPTLVCLGVPIVLTGEAGR